MDKRTTGIVATLATALVCGCPGLFSLCFGAITAFASLVPGADIDIQGSSDQTVALFTGFGALLLGLIFVAIPVVVGYLTLRRKPAPAHSDEPIPPAI